MFFMLLCYKIYNSIKTILKRNITHNPPARYSEHFLLFLIQIHCIYIHIVYNKFVL